MGWSVAAGWIFNFLAGHKPRERRYRRAGEGVLVGIFDVEAFHHDERYPFFSTKRTRFRLMIVDMDLFVSIVLDSVGVR